ncbi:MAG: carboxypeptidase-like regulatory domain-containing protein [Planctomycetota bacterium]
MAPVAGAARDVDASAERTAVADDLGTATRTVASGPARLRGRCLDDRGEPLVAQLDLQSPRVAVPLDRTTRYAQRDGTFELSVPHGVPLELIVRSPRMAGRSAPVPHVEAGAVFDLGDIVMRPGCCVVGTVRDEDGAGCGGALVSLHREPRGSEMRQATRALRVVETRSDPSGGLRFADGLAPGRWRVMAPGLIEPTKVLVVAAGTAELTLDVKVEKTEVARTLSGTVRDETGHPVGQAFVRAFSASVPEGPGDADTQGAAEAAGEQASGEEVSSARTANDGGFTLQRGNRPVGAARLVVEAPGFEDYEDARPRAWGESGIDVRLRRHASVAVRVTRSDGRPVEPFALYVFPAQPTDLSSLRARSSGRHADGLAYAHGVGTGDHVVFVEGPDRALVQGDLVRFRHFGGAARFDVVVDRPVRRRVRCLTTTGQPLAGAAVELLLPLVDRPLTIGTPAAKLIDLWRARGDRALRVMSAMTDARGEAELEGHPQAKYGLRVRGLHHATHLSEIRLGDALPVTEVHMPAGATIRGWFLPAGFARQLDALSARPRVELLRDRDDVPSAASVASVPVDDEGRFTFSHVDPGAWRLDLTWTLPASSSLSLPWGDSSAHVEVVEVDVPSVKLPRGSKLASTAGSRAARDPDTEPRWYGNRMTRRHAVATATTAEGAQVDLPVSAGHLMYGSLRGRVVGAAAAKVRVVWLRRLDVPDAAEIRAELDRDGGFWAWLEPGTYTCALRVGRRAPVRATASEATIVAGQTSDVVFAVDAELVSLRVSRGDGTPVKGIALCVRGTDEGSEKVDVQLLDGSSAASVWFRPGAYRVEFEGKEVATFRVPSPLGAAKVSVKLP